MNWKSINTEQGHVVSRNGVPYITFPSLERFTFLRHGFSTRLGGVSTGFLSSMNLSYGRGDAPVNVTENFRRMGKAIGISTEDFVFTDQVHDVRVLPVGRKDCLREALEEKQITGVDGLVTNEPGVTLVTFHADCVPLFFVDQEKKAIGLSHAGWKGTAGKIGQKTVERMREQYGSRAEHITAVIGPSICKGCYEVGADVADVFWSSFGRATCGSILTKKENGKYLLDLWEANRTVLKEAGIPERRIYCSELCTCCHPELFFSHRASGGKRGNMAAFLCLNKN